MPSNELVPITVAQLYPIHHLIMKSVIKIMLTDCQLYMNAINEIPQIKYSLEVEILHNITYTGF